MSWQPLLEGLGEAGRLLASLDLEVLELTARSLTTAGAATLLAALAGVPLGVALGMGDFRGRGAAKTLVNALVGVPTVTLGLFLYTLFSRNGPLGWLDLLYSVPGIVIGEAVLVTPIVASLVASAVESRDRALGDLVRTLGASEADTRIAVLRESWGGVSLALVSSFNRAFAELGVAMMIGANISGVTRVLTTAIALETAKGEMGLSFALSFILLAFVLVLNFLISRLGRMQR